MDSIFKLGFQKKETVRQAAGESLKRFILIAIVAGLPAFLEGFDGEIYSFGSTYIVPSLTGPVYLSIGLILTGYAIGIAIFSLVGGYLFDRYSVKNTVILSVLIFSAFTIMTGFVTTTPELFIARLGVGVGVGIFQPAGVALLGDIFYETRGKAVSVWATFFSVGLFASPYLIEPFLPAFRLPFEISGALAIIILALVIMIIPVTFKKEKPATKVKLKNVFNRNIILLSISIFFFGIALFAGYLGYFSDYLIKGLSLSDGNAAVIASMAGAGGFIMAFPIGFIADRIGRKYMVIITSLLIAVGSAGMFFLFTSYYGLIIATFIFGSGWGVYVDLLVALGQDSVEDRIVGSISGFLFFIFNVGTIIGGPLYAAFLSKVPTISEFKDGAIITVIIPTVLALVFVIFTKRMTKSTIEEHPEFEKQAS
ncbi:MFS transporter [Ferroplasma sp.]|uniref:MFS transporter n=1 Tax=Ferroplasma sp. TaxID=2591003 RepID=UPI002625332E|nr:MFS transporter [Ferroplasma sp.]MCL4453279.1 MFS transporter [Candidatus Thermoplasmatota archaeon]